MKNTKMATKNLQWTFPGKEFFLMKIETLAIALITLIVFIISMQQLKSIGFSLLFTLIFICLYLVVSYFIQKIRLAEENYKVEGQHLHITRKTRFKTKKVKVDLKKVKHHKFDKFFLGAYLLAEEKKHPLFFRTKKELEKFENHLLKHLPKKRK